MALEILRRQLTVVWWTNIRFEKSFTADLCRLLKASGCIAISAGLEVASDRLLKLMKKGVTVAQVARVAQSFTEAGIMVHAYLMYGFPSQTTQETVDALEMVRQLFEQGIVQSGFWHRFAMTAHSPVGLDPTAYQVAAVGPDFKGFAHNDLEHNDPTGAEHALFSEGLRKSLFNYMHGLCFEFPLSEWFNFEIPQSSIPADYIECCLNEAVAIKTKPNSRLTWLAKLPLIDFYEEEFEEGYADMALLQFFSKKTSWELVLGAEIGQWLYDILEQIHSSNEIAYRFKDLTADFSAAGFGDIEAFIDSEIWEQLRTRDLLLL